MSVYRTIGDMSEGRKNNYDIIRFLAATLVIYQHSYPLGAGKGDGDLIHWLTNGQWAAGALGVAIFFIISGFLITKSYERSNNLLIFTKARILRIYPGLIVTILISTFILGPLVTNLSVFEYLTNRHTYEYIKALKLFPMQWNLPGVFENNVYKSSVNGSLWTIPFEMICYFIVATLGFLGFFRHKTFMVCLFVASMYCYLFYSHIWPNGKQILGLQFIELLRLFNYFSAGMLIYIFRMSLPMNKFFAMFSIIILYISAKHGGVTEAFIFFGSYLTIYFANLPIWKLSQFSKYGDFSYGMYIYAFPIQQLITYCFGGKMGVLENFIYSFAITLVIAILSWHMIEKKALALKNYKLIRIDVPKFINALTQKTSSAYSAVLGLILLLKWRYFIIMFVMIIVILRFSNQAPSVITFPYTKNESIFSGGWQPQSPNENYRWIQNSASVLVEKPKNATVLLIEGFIPENFIELNKVTIYMNDTKITEQSLKSGQPLDITLPISNDLKEYELKLEFNSVHKPDINSPDQRILSALISEIRFK